LDKLQTANFDQKIGVQIIQNALKVCFLNCSSAPHITFLILTLVQAKLAPRFFSHPSVHSTV